MTAGTLAGALLQLVAFGIVGLSLGGWLIRKALPNGRDLGAPERALAAIVGSLLFAIALMLSHIVTGGAVFGVPGVAPALAAVIVFLTRKDFRLPRDVKWLHVGAFAAIVVAIYVLPALIGGSSIRTGDPPWHLGWTEQLLHGEPVPTGPAATDNANAYPWGLHAVLATMTRLIPGSTPMVAHESLHMLLALALPLAAACVARAVRRDAGWAAAGAMTLIGGFGWVRLSGPDFVTSPTQARYGADLVVASPNSVYELFPPGLPRELGLVVLAAALWFLIRGAPADGRSTFATGILVGAVGLISVPLFVMAVLWVIASAVVDPDRPLRWAGRVLGAGLLTFGFWLGPVLSNYVRHGGFVNITPRLGVEWPLHVALASWGLLLPAAVAGGLVAWRARTGRTLLACATGTAVLLGLSILRGAFDWTLGGNATLLHQGRVWPAAHLLGAVFAGFAIVALYRILVTRGRALAVATVGGLFAVGMVSPVAASIALTDRISRDASGFEYGTEDLQPGSFAVEAAARLGPDDVIEVRGSHELAFRLFELSGARLAGYDDPVLEGNELRIRYRELAERAPSEPVEVEYLAVPSDGRASGVVARGRYGGREWVLIRLST